MKTAEEWADSFYKDEVKGVKAIQDDALASREAKPRAMTTAEEWGRILDSNTAPTHKTNADKAWFVKLARRIQLDVLAARKAERLADAKRVQVACAKICGRQYNRCSSVLAAQAIRDADTAKLLEDTG